MHAELDHLNRIDAIAEALHAFSWMEDDEIEQVRERLLDFDSGYWSFIRILSLPLYRELIDLLVCRAALPYLSGRPRIAVIVPVYAARRELLLSALRSLRHQVGVAIDCLISVDGRYEDRQLVEEVLTELGAKEDDSHWRVSVLMMDRNRGVGMCRNRALLEVSAPFFTCLDSDDVFHPLRCLHALLVLQVSGVARLNTGWSRVCLREGKILMINGVISACGHNSFVARTELLSQYGYLADLRVHEDTEYALRLKHFNVPILDSGIVSHYLNSEASLGYESLSTPLRKEVIPINDHPYLCGSVLAEPDAERLQIEQRHSQLYRNLLSEALLNAFPPI